MAWTRVTFACGHTDRRQFYGRDVQRLARLAYYRQRDCEECFRRKTAARDAGRLRPARVTVRAGGGRALITARQTFDCWRYFARRGYRLETDHERSATRWDDVEGYRETPTRRCYVRELRLPDGLEATEAALLAELRWLLGIGARIETEPAVVQWARANGVAIDAPRARPLPTPRALLQARLPGHLRARAARAVRDIRNALRRVNRPYIAFSGGKDSTALAVLVHAVNPEIPLIWSDDELEYPETVALMERLQADLAPLIIVRGHATHAGWFTSWSDTPFFRGPLPGTIDIPGHMDDWARADGFDLAFVGLRREESHARDVFLSEVGPTYRRRTGLICCPLEGWSADDVWALIRATRTPYNAAYDRLREIEVPDVRQRVGPLPLTPHMTLALGWPDLLTRLEARYGPRWP